MKTKVKITLETKGKPWIISLKYIRLHIDMYVCFLQI